MPLGGTKSDDIAVDYEIEDDEVDAEGEGTRGEEKEEMKGQRVLQSRSDASAAGDPAKVDTSKKTKVESAAAEKSENVEKKDLENGTTIEKKKKAKKKSLTKEERRQRKRRHAEYDAFKNADKMAVAAFKQKVADDVRRELRKYLKKKRISSREEFKTFCREITHKIVVKEGKHGNDTAKYEKKLRKHIRFYVDAFFFKREEAKKRKRSEKSDENRGDRGEKDDEKKDVPEEGENAKKKAKDDR